MFDCMNERVAFLIWCGADSDLLIYTFLCIDNVWYDLRCWLGVKKTNDLSIYLWGNPLVSVCLKAFWLNLRPLEAVARCCRQVPAWRLPSCWSILNTLCPLCLSWWRSSSTTTATRVSWGTSWGLACMCPLFLISLYGNVLVSLLYFSDLSFFSSLFSPISY